MPTVAFMTYGEIHEARDHPRVAEFFVRAIDAYAQAESASGHLATADVEGVPWGPRRHPNFGDDATPEHLRHPVQTLSLWRDLESVVAFSYSGAHLAALKKRRSWFRRIAVPGYVAWWIVDDAVPTWAEACERIEHLHEHGPTPYAFDFARAFAASGAPYRVDRARALRPRLDPSETELPT